MFKIISTKEETILKRAFNRWGIFDIYENLEILIKPLKHESMLVSDHSGPSQDFLKYSSSIKRMENTQVKYKQEEISRDFEVYICSNREQKELTIKLQPMHSGIIIGQVRNKKFLPNLNFAELVVNYNPRLNYPYVILENKGANLVLYGRDIMGNSIIDFFREIKENQILIILNQTKEVIGIGRSKYNNNLITQKDKITIDNIQDIGTHYLKKENNYMLV
jgi:60S ribosome subunit biogenesis protein NIP7